MKQTFTLIFFILFANLGFSQTKDAENYAARLEKCDGDYHCIFSIVSEILNTLRTTEDEVERLNKIIKNLQDQNKKLKERIKGLEPLLVDVDTLSTKYINAKKQIDEMKIEEAKFIENIRIVQTENNQLQYTKIDLTNIGVDAEFKKNITISLFGKNNRMLGDGSNARDIKNIQITIPELEYIKTTYQLNTFPNELTFKVKVMKGNQQIGNESPFIINKYNELQKKDIPFNFTENGIYEIQVRFNFPFTIVSYSSEANNLDIQLSTHIENKEIVIVKKYNLEKD